MAMMSTLCMTGKLDLVKQLLLQKLGILEDLFKLRPDMSSSDCDSRGFLRSNAFLPVRESAMNSRNEISSCRDLFQEC